MQRNFYFIVLFFVFIFLPFIPSFPLISFIFFRHLTTGVSGGQVFRYPPEARANHHARSDARKTPKSLAYFLGLAIRYKRGCSCAAPDLESLTDLRGLNAHCLRPELWVTRQHLWGGGGWLTKHYLCPASKLNFGRNDKNLCVFLIFFGAGRHFLKKAISLHGCYGSELRSRPVN